VAEYKYKTEHVFLHSQTYLHLQPKHLRACYTCVVFNNIVDYFSTPHVNMQHAPKTWDAATRYFVNAELEKAYHNIAYKVKFLTEAQLNDPLYGFPTPIVREHGALQYDMVHPPNTLYRELAVAKFFFPHFERKKLIGEIDRWLKQRPSRAKSVVALSKESAWNHDEVNVAHHKAFTWLMAFFVKLRNKYFFQNRTFRIILQQSEFKSDDTPQSGTIVDKDPNWPYLGRWFNEEVLLFRVRGLVGLEMIDNDSVVVLLDHHSAWRQLLGRVLEDKNCYPAAVICPNVNEDAPDGSNDAKSVILAGILSPDRYYSLV
jgi:hypothetical protein